jgi:hypothetical protein
VLLVPGFNRGRDAVDGECNLSACAVCSGETTRETGKTIKQDGEMLREVREVACKGKGKECQAVRLRQLLSVLYVSLLCWVIFSLGTSCELVDLKYEAINYYFPDTFHQML